MGGAGSNRGNPSIQQSFIMSKLFVIKIGGNIIDNDEKLQAFLKEFASVKEKRY